jgi:ketosteroid isomerase-like protein
MTCDRLPEQNTTLSNDGRVTARAASRRSVLAVAASAPALIVGALPVRASGKGALQVAQDYVRFIETADRDGIARSLAENVTQVFPISSEATGEPQGIFSGKEEVVEYTYGLFRKFRNLRWPDARWIASADGKTAIMEGRGDATVVHSGIRYNNVYITRFDVEDGLIVQIAEYANATLYTSLGIEPSEVEMRAVERVQPR